MLAGHSQLFCPPELNLLPFDTMVERNAQLGECRMERYRDLGLNPAQGLQRALMELLGDAAGANEWIETWIRSGQSISSVYSILGRLVEPRRLVDKSPFYSASIDTLRRAEQLFRRPLYIYLFRHPYTVIASLVRNRFRPAPGRDLFGAGESLWARANSNILSFLSRIEPEREIRIRFEELAREPAFVLMRLCSFLGIPFEEAVLRPYEGKRMTDGVRPGLVALGDVDFCCRDRIDPEPADRCERIRLPMKLTAAAPVARLLGYELPFETQTATVPC
jgi:hypothetical protein